MAEKQTIRLLLLHDSQDQAELLINAIRNSGKATRAKLVNDEDGLDQALKSSWDVLIARPKVGNVTAETTIDMVKRIGKDIPIIFVGNVDEMDEASNLIKRGAKDLIPAAATKHALAAINRELDNLALRRKLRELEIDLQEAEHRVNLLLSTSQDAVAYVTDGMHIHANGAYVELFGYEDPDDLAGMPIMDMIDEENWAELKKQLKLQNQEGASGEMEFKGLKEDGATFNGNMYLSQATYEDEPCIQIIIRSEAEPVQVGVDDAELEARLQEAKFTDPATGLKNKLALVDRANEKVAKAAKEQLFSSMFYVAIDSFRQHRADLGISGCDQMILSVANLVTPVAGDEAQIFRAGDGSLAICHPGTDFTAAESLADNIRKVIDEAVIDVEGRTVQVTASVGAAIISENITSGQMIIDRVFQAASDAQAESKNGNAYKIHDPAADIPDDADLSLADHLQKAIDEDQFTLMFQSIIDLHDESAEFYEVSLTLERGDETLTNDEIYSGAKPCQLLSKIDRWVIFNAIKRLAEHRAKGHTTRLLIPLSIDSIQDDSLVAWLTQALRAAKIPYDAIVFSLDEGDVSAALTQSSTFTKELKELKITTAISRFGCNIQPMKIAQNIAADIFKLDTSYTQELSSEENKQATMELIEQLQGMDRQTIAAGIESAMDMQNVYQLGVTYIQGGMLQGPTEKLSSE